MPNPWIEHVRKYAKDNNLTYACAITHAKSTYTKKDGTKSTASNQLPQPNPETPKPETSNTERKPNIFAPIPKHRQGRRR